MRTAHLVLALLAVHYIAAQKRTEDEDWGEGEEGAQTQIINGDDSKEGEFPFMVRLVQTQDMEHFCGGALLNTKLVLTAAHCVKLHGIKDPVDSFRVVLGDHKTSDQSEANEKVMEPMRVLVHEDYYNDPTGVPVNDIALIVLKDDVTLKDGAIATIARADSDSSYNEGTAVTVIGWGVDKDDAARNDVAAEILQKLEYDVSKKEDCFKYYEEDNEKKGNYGSVEDWKMEAIADGMFCAIDAAREGTAFRGDSGGPMFNSKNELVGLVSWGPDDPKEVSYNVGVNVFYYKEWIEKAMKRSDDESWVELQTRGSHGPVIVHDKNGKKSTICNDDVGKNEVDAICREQGFKMGTLASVWDYQSSGRRRRNKEPKLPPFGYTKLSCKDDVEVVMNECDKKEYKDAEAPCFDGHQLAVRCADEAWSFKVTHIKPSMRSLKGTEFVRGRVSCTVEAKKYGKDLDFKNQVQVGLVIRGDTELTTIEDMRYRKKSSEYVGKFRQSDEITTNTCFACIAYLPGTEFHTVGKLGPNDCPDNGGLYEKWVQEQNDQNNQN